jgi:seryl-tRNA synthetase
MLQVNFIKQNRQLVIERLAVRNIDHAATIDHIIALDEERKKLQTEAEQVQSEINTLSKQVGRLMASGKQPEARKLKEKIAEFKIQLQPLQEGAAATEKFLTEQLIKLPNLPHASVPAGKGAEDNELVKEGGAKPALHDGAMPHWDLALKYDLINFETGNKLTGSGFPLYKNKGAKLQRSLIQYFLDFNTAAGYIEFQPPLMVNEASAYGTGQLPDKEGQMYYDANDNLYLIPTSEVPLTNIYRDDIIKENHLPIKMTAYTPCFRREAGSYGRDVRGLNRLHQFDKVEIVQLTKADNSYKVHQQLVDHVEKLLQSLQLPYRILRLCGGDMGFTSALTYDFEVYSAAQQKWLEVSSVSNFETFQSNRMKIRYKDDKGKTNLVHTLNGSSLALPRIVACLLENFQTKDGIELPEVLWKYFGDKIIN